MDPSSPRPASAAGRRSEGPGALAADTGTLAADDGAITADDGAASAEAKARLDKADRLVLAIVCLAQFMVVLDISIVNVALPSIQTDLKFSAANLQWVVTAYSLTFGGLLLLGGRLADLFGRRRIFLLGLILFTGASLLGGFAGNQGTLIAARSLQGVGAAVLSPATLTILTVTFTDQRARAKALGVWSAVAAGGGAAGALFGGFLTQYLSWRWILFVNVPIGVALFLFARLFLHESRAEGPRRRLDVAGSITVTVGLLALVYTIVHTDQVSWTSRSTLLTGTIAVVLLALFALIEARLAGHPLVPLRLFRSRAVTGANLVMFCFGVAMFAMWYFLSLYLQEVLGYDPVITGLTFLPQTAAIAVGATIAGRLAPRLGPRNVLVAGAACAAMGLYWLSFIRAGDSYWTGACGGGILATFGMGLAFTPIALSATGGVAREEAGLASGLVNSSRQIGASLGLAVLSTVAASHIASQLAGRSVVTEEIKHVAMTAGYARGFLIASVIALLGGALAFIIPSQVAAATPAAVEAPATAADGQWAAAIEA
ncbi:MAG TPA: MFS transporter [Acidimicrobiales bacterium]|nr:MFS transporter [Acidimicrobiales bacterium]